MMSLIIGTNLYVESICVVLFFSCLFNFEYLAPKNFSLYSGGNKSKNVPRSKDYEDLSNRFDEIGRQVVEFDEENVELVVVFIFTQLTVFIILEFGILPTSGRVRR